MEKVSASHFKTHFGDVLDRASHGVLRIERRGRDATVLLSAEAYDALKRQAALAANEEDAAMERLAAFALGEPRPVETLRDDARGSAILNKHTKHWKP